MKSNLNFLFKYLSNEKIEIDKEEFDFQFKSHPDYPSLLALSDTLTFFNIRYEALRVDSGKLEYLPESFITIIDNGGGINYSYVKFKNNFYTYSDEYGENKNTISSENFKKIWKNIIILINNENIVTYKKTNSFLLNLIPFLSLIGVIILINHTDIWLILFCIFSSMGFLLSLLSIKDLLNIQSGLFSKLCNASSSFNCDTVINSPKWKFLKKLSFSDISLTFFTSQIIALLFFKENIFEYFVIQKWLLLLSIPIILISLYYQKFVIKKWCPICILITIVLFIELFYVLYIPNLSLIVITWHSFILYLTISLMVFTAWLSIKHVLLSHRDLKEANIKSMRFKRSYFIFKNSLLAMKKYFLPESHLVFGNKHSSLNIDIITSPFCQHCVKPHDMLNEMIHKYGENITVKIIYFIDIKNIDDVNKKSLYRNLINIKIMYGDDAFNEALNFWIKVKNYDTWFLKYNTSYKNEEIDIILDNQYQWCLTNNFNFTPCLFINGYKYPSEYDISDLPYFINELIDDDFFR